MRLEAAQPAAEVVTGRLQAASKYRHIHPDTIAYVVRQEAVHASDKADLERRARLKLHKVAGGYLFTGRATQMLRGLDAEVAADPPRLREWCRAALANHFSSAERLPDLDRFYPAVFDVTGPAATVADVACAINPFSLPWLRDVSDAHYVGYDLNMSYVEIGRAFLALAFPEDPAEVHYRDALFDPASITADVALLLKTYHSIEDRQAGAGLRLVAGLGVRHVVVSFPVKAMHGRVARFPVRHIAELEELAQQHDWQFRRTELPTEVLVVVTKPGGAGGAEG